MAPEGLNDRDRAAKDKWLEWLMRCPCGAILRKRDPWEIVRCGCGYVWGDETRGSPRRDPD